MATMKLSEALRTAIADSGWPIKKLAKEAGVGYASAWRFVRTGRAHMDVVDRLAAAVGVELVPTGKGPRSKGRGERRSAK